MSVKTKRIQLKTSEDLSEDGFSSSGSRTPSLVARLMGLDLLPESSSPAFSTSTTKISITHTQPGRGQMKSSGTRSLPDSPRTSYTRWSDVDLHHRLSLQVSKKDGNGEDEALCKRREMIKSLVQKCEAEGWSPGHYAKQIVKQVKESVGRSKRVGLAEITNTVKGRDSSERRRDEHLLPAGIKIKIKTKKPSLSSKKSIQKKEDDENEEPITNSNTQIHLPVLQSTSLITSQKLKCRKAVVEDKFKFTTSSASQGNTKNKKIEMEPLFIRPTSASPTANQHRNKSPIMSKKTPLSTKQFNITTTATRTSLHRIKQVYINYIFLNFKASYFKIFIF